MGLGHTIFQSLLYLSISLIVPVIGINFLNAKEPEYQLPEPSLLTPGDHEILMNHRGRRRSYIVHIPPQAIGGGVMPLVLNFHGGGSNAASHQRYSKMDIVSDKSGFMVVYPNGTGVFPGRLLTWNAGTCCGYAVKNKVDDVEFVMGLLRDLGGRANIDPSRIYATGLSNGAMMTYRLALEIPELIHAIAPVAGAMVATNFTPKRPVSIMHVHSIDDPRALYDGGLGPPFPFTNDRVLHQSVEAQLSKWITFAKCPYKPRTDAVLVKKDKTENKQRASRLVFAPCQHNTRVVLWKMEGVGHVWPGGEQSYLTNLLGPSTMIIDANEEIWRFFSGE